MSFEITHEYSINDIPNQNDMSFNAYSPLQRWPIALFRNFENLRLEECFSEYLDLFIDCSA